MTNSATKFPDCADKVVARGIRLLVVADRERPALPIGWRFEGRGHFLVAVTPCGAEYFIENHPNVFVLVARRLVSGADVTRTNGRLRFGQIYADTEGNKIIIQKSLVPDPDPTKRSDHRSASVIAPPSIRVET